VPVASTLDHPRRAMLDALRRLFARRAEKVDWAAVVDWARHRQAQFKRTHDGAGFVVAGVLEGRPWRLEWGPPQRNYIEGNELRLRMALGLSQELNMMVMSRPLMETLESRTFDDYTADLQTQIDVATPEEMRWLAMFPRVPLTAAKDLKQHFGAVALSASAAAAWIEGPLCERLSAAAHRTLAADPPFVLMTLRGRLYLRLQLPDPDVPTIDAMVTLFETAAVQAVHAGAGPGEGHEAWPHAASTAWQTQLEPEDRK
jgi:hypothetical protein